MPAKEIYKDKKGQVCKICGKYKSYKEFYVRSGSTCYYTKCKACMAEIRKKYPKYREKKSIRYIDTTVVIKEDICPELTLDMIPGYSEESKYKIEDFYLYE